ncbi:vacuolar protein sorting-associated protein 54, chloroplastic isoform X2 [Aristolochia californica]|uniref:vacuolar protein sorting-associated protein 54, chloroplastic isoform X2 n=1 Tax=Aristolochia californica TaxID=171875 RepID=UPI0035D59535
MDSLPSQSGRPSAANSAEISLSTVKIKEPATTSFGRINSSSNRSNSDVDSPSYHSLSSILNNPHVGKSGVYSADGWTSWWAPSANPPEIAPPVTLNKTFLDISRSDFQTYLAAISEPYGRFEDIQLHASKESPDPEIPSISSRSGPGEALVACLREVPSLYFKEDFALEEGATFRAACPFSTISENMVLQEKLSHYLDVVEVHLVKEIALRSDSFFEAQGQLQDLNVRIVEACGRIRELKETIRLLDAGLVGPAREIQELNATRSNLLALQEKLRLIVNVNQALSALKLLVASGDCTGALDVTDDLQHLLDSDELTGLHCFRHLRDQLVTSVDSINSILSAEFMRACIHDTKDADSAILSKLKFKLDEEESSALRDRLLPLIIGLLRTARLPSVLRIYRDTLVADMKTAIKNTVAELLPILVARPVDPDFAAGERAELDGTGLSLASKLRSLSSEGFVQLLVAIFKIVQAHLVHAAEVKKVIEWIMGSLDGYYAAGETVTTTGAVYVEETSSHVSPYLPYFLQKNASRFPLVQGKMNEAAASPTMPKNFRADVLRENTEAIFAACDAAHGRWAKLLGVRALLHPKLRLQEFVSIYNLTQDFQATTEKIGGRSGFSIRGTLQSQSKAFLEFQHETRMTKIKAVLDQETWVSVEVPDEFQGIVEWLTAEASTNGRFADAHTTAALSNDIGWAPTNNDVSADNSIGQPKQVKPSSVKKDGNNIIEPGKSTSLTLMCRGVCYHMVNCGLILLKMLAEYIDISKCLPLLSPEVVNRVIEILKLFNTRTCQLVLGAGAMQVSGLKSITSKHLALASQVISFTYAIIPDIRRILLLQIPESKAQMQSDIIDKVAQDYKVHRDEIHTKLVQIMRERVLVHLRGLPQIVESWSRTEENEQQPSQFARSLTKEVGYLQRVLSRTLHEMDVQSIFRQVVEILHAQLSEAFSSIDISNTQVKKRLYQDIQHILGCIHTLPSGISMENNMPNSGKLDEFLAQRLRAEEADQ